MKIKQYFEKTKEFFSNLFRYKNIEDKTLNYGDELINLYNSFMMSLERMYSGFSGGKLQFAPVTAQSFRTNYEDLFSDNIKRKFSIYKTNKGLLLRNKGLEKHLII